MKKNLGIDLFRTIAIFTVVLIHSASIDISHRDGILKLLPPANACFAFWAGWFLFKFDSKYSLKDIVGVLKKRFCRLLYPYLVWESIYVFVNMGFDLLQGKFELPSATDWVGIVFLGTGSVQLWFVITLVYVQVVLCATMALVEGVTNNISIRLRNIGTAVGFIVFSAFALFWREFGIECDYLRRFIFLLGYGALAVGLRFATSLILPWFGYFIRVGLMSVGFSVVVMSWTFSIPECVRVLSWCLAFGCMPVKFTLQKLNWLTPVSGCVMGIYLCHVLFTRIIAFALPLISSFIKNGYVIVVFNAIMAFAFSVIAVMFIRRFARIKWIGC